MSNSKHETPRSLFKKNVAPKYFAPNYGRENTVLQTRGLKISNTKKNSSRSSRNTRHHNFLLQASGSKITYFKKKASRSTARKSLYQNILLQTGSYKIPYLKRLAPQCSAPNRMPRDDLFQIVGKIFCFRHWYQKTRLKTRVSIWSVPVGFFV